MNTIKKFIHYYGPYKAVFFIDLICAAVISLVDLAYPQILRTMTKTLFTQDKDIILHALPVIAVSLFVMYIVQSLCKYYVTCQGHMMGAKMERDMRRELHGDLDHQRRSAGLLLYPVRRVKKRPLPRLDRREASGYNTDRRTPLCGWPFAVELFRY